MDETREYATLDEFYELVCSYNEEDIDKVLKAYRYAAEKHAGKTRESGSPYITHPLTVAYILAEMNADSNTLCAALLHDVVEDTDTTLDDIRREFNDDIAEMVDGVTKISNIDFMNKADQINANTRKMIVSLMKDPRTVIIKLADRLHNMRTLGYKKSTGKQELKALETLLIYVPLADRLGMHKLKTELEDLSFKYYDPEQFKLFKEIRANSINSYREIFDEMVDNIKTALARHDVPAKVLERVRGVFNLYNKNIIRGVRLEDIHDLLAIKVINKEVLDCYKTLGIINQHYTPHNSEVKDFIGAPKVNNLYKSIHDAIFGKGNRIIQVRITTEDFDFINSLGIAAFWKIFKGKAKEKMLEALKKSCPFYTSLINLNDEMERDQDFVDGLQEEIFQEKIYVQTGTGQTLELPVGSNTIDAAYAQGEWYGNNLIGVKINNIYPADLTMPLKSGDIVEIVVADHEVGPDKRWLDIVKTTNARVGIKTYRPKILIK